MTQPLNIKVDSGQARADLDALAKSLDAAGAAAGRMSTGIAAGMNKSDASIKGAMGNMEKFAQVSAALSKIKVDSSGTKAIGEFSRVLGQVAKTAAIDNAKMASWSKFIEMGALSSRLKMDAGAASSLTAFTRAMDAAARTRGIDSAKMASWVKFLEIGARASQLRMGSAGMVGFTMFAQAMDNVSKSRGISSSKLKSWVDFIEVAARSQRLRFDPATAASLTAMGNAMANLKGPGKGSIERLEKMFQVLASARRIPNAKDLANDLDLVAQAASRASAALANLPARLRGMGGGGGGGAGGIAGMGRQLRDAASGAEAAGGTLNRFSGHADKAGKSSFTLSERLRGLNNRFSLAHQAGSLFNAAFASFTIGGMIKGVFDATINLAKLEKAMLFTTKSYEGSKRATNEFIGTVYDMGLALDQVSEPFGRFTISSSAAGLSAADSSAIFRSVTQTLQVVGASAEQTGYAMYGLTQMIQKGKVSSEEFSRQIGEQIPGNAEAGRRALERMTGQAVTMQQFFKQMSLGKIESPQFTKLWAEELNTMFSGLMGLVKDRPDVALNRLKTSWTVFQQTVGKGGFMAEAGIQFNRLAEMIGKTENGVFKLNPRFEHLAKMLGQNLARMVRSAGDAMVWLADNVEKVIFAAKAIATLFVAKTFLGWGKAALTAVSGIGEMTKSLLGLKAAQDAVDAGGVPIPGRNTAKVARAARTVQQAEDVAASTVAASGTGMFGRRRRGPAPTGGAMADIMNMRAANGYGRGAPQAAYFGNRFPVQGPARGPNIAGAVGNAAAFGMRGRGVPVSLGTRVAQGASTVGGAAARGVGAVASAAPGIGAMAGRAAMLALGGFGIAAVAAAGALVLLSDKTTKVGDANVKFIDIMQGAISTVTSKIGGFFNDMFNRIFKSSDGFQKFLDNLGPVMQSTVDYLILFGEVIADTITGFVQMGVAIYKLVTGDGAGAKAEMDALKKNWSDNNPFDAQNMASRGAEGRLATIEAANKRMTEELGNNAAEQRVRDAAAQLAAQTAADDQLKAANLQLQAARDMTESMATPTVSSVMTRLTALADGTFGSAHPSMTAADRTAANVAATAQAPVAAPAGTALPPVAPQSQLSYSHTITTGAAAGRTVTAASADELAQAVYAAASVAPTARNAGPRPTQEITGFLGEFRTAVRDVIAPTREQTQWSLQQNARPVTETPAQAAERRRQAGIEARLAVAGMRNTDVTAAQRNAAASGSGDGLAQAVALLQRKEGFAGTAYADMTMRNGRRVNSGYRAGYGSDTTTDASTGAISRIRQGQTVSREDSEADLRRRAQNFQSQASGEIGAEVWSSLTGAAQAALTSVIYNYGTLDKTRSGGGAGIADEIRGGQTSPAQIAALVEGLAGHNSGINADRRREEAQMIRTGVGGPAGAAAPAGAGGPTAAQAAEDEIDKAKAAKSNDWKSLQSVLALPDPASQSLSRANALTEQLNDLAIKDEERVKKWGNDSRLITADVLQQINASYQRVFKEMSEAMNPLAKQNKDLQRANDLTLMTAAGMGRQAQWQEKINDLRDQGYDIDLMSDEVKWQEHINRLRQQGMMVNAENLNVTRANFEAEMDRKEAIEAQISLLQTLNEAQMRTGQRSGRRTQRDSYFADLVNQSQEGGTYDQKLAAVNANPRRAAAMNAQADVQWLSDRADALAEFATQASDITRAAGMNATQNAYDDTYTDALRRITGLTAASRDELVKTASEADKALAGGFAKLREELENQPGFARWADQLEPLAKRMEDIKGQFMDGLSDGITDELMGEDVDWTSIFKNIRKQMVKAQVDSALASLTNLISGRKPGEVTLSPEAQAAKDSMTAAQQATEQQIAATRDSTAAMLQAANESAELAAAARTAADGVHEMIPLIRQAADALTASANALAAQAGTAPPAASGAAASPNSLDLSTLMGPTRTTTTVDPVTALLGDGTDATAGVNARVAERAAGTTDVTAMIARLTALPAGQRDVRAALSTPLPTDRSIVQGTLPGASDTRDVTQDNSNFFQTAFRAVTGHDVGGMTTDRRMATAAQASTATTDGPTASFAAGDDAGLTSAAQSVFDAGASLSTVPQAFGPMTEGFNQVVTKFAEAVDAFGQAVANMGSGSGGGGNPLDMLTGGGGTPIIGGSSSDPIADLWGLYADGGYVSGKGGPTSDDINARLSNGEFVINAQATAQNRGLLEAINGGKAYASGGLVDGLPGFAGGGRFSDIKAANLSSIFGKGKNGKYDGPGAAVGQMFGKGNSMETRMTGGMTALTALSTLAELFGKKKKPEVDPKAIQGVIGEHRGVTVDATEIAAHENPWMVAIDMGMDMLTGGTWGKTRAYGQMASSAVKGIGSAFAQGGYVSSAGAGGMDWSSAPHYKEGTANTSGGMPAVVHPNEAVIPLSGGRKVGVDMSGMDSDRSISNTVTSNITVIAPNPDAFRKSQGSIQRQQNRDSRRAATRNLTP